MNKTSTDILNEKVELIYEYDNSSPLFVRVANLEVERNNLERAIEILNKGLELYPTYPSGYMVLGKAFLLKGDYENANECFKTGSDLIQSPKSYGYYQNDLESIKKQRSPFQNLKIQDFAKAKIAEESVNASKGGISTIESFSAKKNEEASIPAVDDNVINVPESFDNTIENRLDEIAKDLSSIKIQSEPEQMKEPEKPVKPEPPANEKTNKIIPSETLAKIYISQGEFREAISVYKKLLVTEPSKKLYYASRIKEIEEQLDINNF